MSFAEKEQPLSSRSAEETESADRVRGYPSQQMPAAGGRLRGRSWGVDGHDPARRRASWRSGPHSLIAYAVAIMAGLPVNEDAAPSPALGGRRSSVQTTQGSVIAPVRKLSGLSEQRGENSPFHSQQGCEDHRVMLLRLPQLGLLGSDERAGRRRVLVRRHGFGDWGAHLARQSGWELGYE